MSIDSLPSVCILAGGPGAQAGPMADASGEGKHRWAQQSFERAAPEQLGLKGQAQAHVGIVPERSLKWDLSGAVRGRAPQELSPFLLATVSDFPSGSCLFHSQCLRHWPPSGPSHWVGGWLCDQSEPMGSHATSHREGSTLPLQGDVGGEKIWRCGSHPVLTNKVQCLSGNGVTMQVSRAKGE